MVNTVAYNNDWVNYHCALVLLRNAKLQPLGHVHQVCALSLQVKKAKRENDLAREAVEAAERRFVQREEGLKRLEAETAEAHQRATR